MCGCTRINSYCIYIVNAGPRLANQKDTVASDVRTITLGCSELETLSRRTDEQAVYCRRHTGIDAAASPATIGVVGAVMFVQPVSSCATTFAFAGVTVLAVVVAVVFVAVIVVVFVVVGVATVVLMVVLAVVVAVAVFLFRGFLFFCLLLSFFLFAVGDVAVAGRCGWNTRWR